MCPLESFWGREWDRLAWTRKRRAVCLQGQPQQEGKMLKGKLTLEKSEVLGRSRTLESIP